MGKEFIVRRNIDVSVKIIDWALQLTSFSFSANAQSSITFSALVSATIKLVHAVHLEECNRKWWPIYCNEHNKLYRSLYGHGVS